jgi:23S rRNA pseudouridine1911/1915/1917 synthase
VDEDADLEIPATTFTIVAEDAGRRLDQVLAGRFPQHSRTWLSRLVDEGHVEVVPQPGSRARRVRPSMPVEPGDVVSVRLVPKDAPYAVPERIPLHVVHEDEWLIVIDKPAGLTVHPGAGEKSGTLANALAWHFGELSHVQGPLRPGIVHRLDRDTSGVMVVAKDDTTHWALADQFRRRTVRKEYHAVVKGRVELDADLISGPIGPDRRQPTRMAIRVDVGRASETYYEVIERMATATLVRCLPKTGRTHQIRVHMASAGYPLLSDRSYGGLVQSVWELCPRHALHARSLTIRHPATGDDRTFEAPLPADMTRLIEHLRAS